MLKEPLSPPAAKKLILEIITTGIVEPSTHGVLRLGQHKMTMVDVVNVLRGGKVEPAEFENGTWRYLVWTARMTVVVAFDSETELAVVTARRNK